MRREFYDYIGKRLDYIEPSRKTVYLYICVRRCCATYLLIKLIAGKKLMYSVNNHLRHVTSVKDEYPIEY